MITRKDDTNKNDCERNSSKRFIADFRTDHPHLRTIVVEDALATNNLHIQHLRNHNLHFILGVKPDGNRLLFEWIDRHPDVQPIHEPKEQGKGSSPISSAGGRMFP